MPPMPAMPPDLPPPGVNVPSQDGQSPMAPPQLFPRATATPPPSSPRKPMTRFAVVGGAGIVLVLVVLLVIRALAAPSYAGQWEGTGLVSGNGTGSTISLSGEYAFYLTLTQQNAAIGGTGQLCYNSDTGIHPATFNVSGSTQGARAQLFVSAADVNQIVTGNTPINATLSGGTLSLTFVDATLSLTATLHQGTQSQYRSACNGLTPRAS